MKTMTRLFVLSLVLAISAACATTSPRTGPRSEFEDIPVPKGLTYLDVESVIIESPQVKAARLLYRGRIEPVSLGAALRSTLEANGWRHVSTTSGREGAMQVYQKGGNSLQVRVWEGWIFTYVELTASRALTAAKPVADQR